MRLLWHFLSLPTCQRQEVISGTAQPCRTARSTAGVHNLKPGRRRRGRGWHATLVKLARTWCLVLFISVALCGISEAEMVETDIFESDLFKAFARSGAIMVDPRPGPPCDQRIDKRQNADLFGGTSTTASPPVVSSTISSSTAGESTAASTTPAAAPSAAAKAPLPKPFDSSIGSNFTSSACPNFLNSFLQNDAFQKCLPFSQLLQNSNSFFQASHSITRITQTLDATCSADFAKCSTLMALLGTQLKDNANCGADYQQQNSLIQQAYNGFVAYSPLFQASCLKDSVGNYCFGRAITNDTNPSDAYIYYLPLGTTLPGSSRPTCSTCLKETMRVFVDAAGNLSQPISTTYANAATQINSGCGPDFVNSTFTPIKGSQPSPNAAGARLAVYSMPVLIAMIVGFWGLSIPGPFTA